MTINMSISRNRNQSMKSIRLHLEENKDYLHFNSTNDQISYMDGTKKNQVFVFTREYNDLFPTDYLDYLMTIVAKQDILV